MLLVGRTCAASKRLLYNLSGILFHLDDFTTLVVTALGTDAMLHARLLTIWTDDGLRCPQGIVRPPLTAPRFRVTSFWIWHDYSTKDFRSQSFDFGFRLRSDFNNIQRQSEIKNLNSQMFQSFPARIDFLAFTLTSVLVPVNPAHRTKTLALLSA